MTPIHKKNSEANEEKASSPRSRRYKTITPIVIALLLFPLGYFIYSYYQAKEEENIRRVAKEEAERKAKAEAAFYEQINAAAQVMESVDHINWEAKIDELRKIYDKAREYKITFDSISVISDTSNEKQRARLAINSVDRFYAAAKIAMNRIIARNSIYNSMRFEEVVDDFISLILEFNGSH
ncbi:MAG: hypothetical protein Q4A24_09505 [Akkermansia sp.]|nr:hypothetical protein [Akkermansia sp.]